MKSPKRMLLIATPVLLLSLGAALHAAPKRPMKCGQPPSLIMAVAQKLGLAAKPAACETASPNIPGEWCVNDGHNCRDANGTPGKCTSVYDGSMWSCVCAPHGKL